MKKIILLVTAGTFFLACGSGDSSTEKTGTGKEAPAPADITQDPVYQKGVELIGQSDCLTCHKIEEKLQGPSYRDVANKYAGMPDTIITHLAGKIIQGGSGVWGEIMMTAHPDLSQEDAEAMVKYILLLKK